MYAPIPCEKPIVRQTRRRKTTENTNNKKKQRWSIDGHPSTNSLTGQRCDSQRDAFCKGSSRSSFNRSVRRCFHNNNKNIPWHPFYSPIHFELDGNNQRWFCETESSGEREGEERTNKLNWWHLPIIIRSCYLAHRTTTLCVFISFKREAKIKDPAYARLAFSRSRIAYGFVFVINLRYRYIYVFLMEMFNTQNFLVASQNSVVVVFRSLFRLVSHANGRPPMVPDRWNLWSGTASSEFSMEKNVLGFDFFFHLWRRQKV